MKFAHIKKNLLFSLFFFNFFMVNSQLPRVKENVSKNTFKIIGVGDMMLGTNYPSKSYLPPKGTDLLKDVRPYLLNADVTFGNLEGTVLNEEGHVKKCSDPSLCYAFRQPEYLIKNLKDAGFDLLSVANNHVGDFGEPGRKNTMKVLSEMGFAFSGIEARPWDTVTINNLKVGFCSFSPNRGTVKITDIANAKAIVENLNALTDVVIVSFHGGAEGASKTHVTKKTEYFYGENRGNVHLFSHAVIDAGADIVFGHGPHVTRTIELYKNRLICYSLGNFCTYGRFNLKGLSGVGPIVEVSIKKDGSFVEGNIISTKQIGKGIPLIDETDKALKEIKRLLASDFPNNNIEFEGSKFKMKK
ncbi:MAG: CapA family protein [Crocinitomicaceae bacterium]|nr:CapA family protein [Crocinitomicaceae bacterium]